MSAEYVKQLERDVEAHKSVIALLKAELRQMTHRRRVIQHGLKQIRVIISEKERLLNQANGENE